MEVRDKTCRDREKEGGGERGGDRDGTKKRRRDRTYRDKRSDARGERESDREIKKKRKRRRKERDRQDVHRDGAEKGMREGERASGSAYGRGRRRGCVCVRGGVRSFFLDTKKYERSTRLAPKTAAEESACLLCNWLRVPAPTPHFSFSSKIKLNVQEKHKKET